MQKSTALTGINQHSEFTPRQHQLPPQRKFSPREMSSNNVSKTASCSQRLTS